MYKNGSNEGLSRWELPDLPIENISEFYTSNF